MIFPRCRKDSKKGLTLLETIIALVIFAAAATALFWALSKGIAALADVENVDLALNIAQENLENIRNTPLANVTDSGPAADPDFSNFSVAVDAAEGQNPKQADVTVSWQEKGGAVNITLTTIVAEY